MDGIKPWAYRPQKHDDWGIIRDADGDLVMRACGAEFSDHDLCNAHRAAGTAPLGERAKAVVRAVNCHDDLVAALKDLIAGWGDGLDDLFWNAGRAILAKAEQPT